MDSIVDLWPVIAGLVALGVSYGMLVMGQKAARREVERVESEYAKEMKRVEQRLNAMSQTMTAYQLDTQGRLSRMEAILQDIQNSRHHHREGNN